MREKSKEKCPLGFGLRKKMEECFLGKWLEK